MVRKRSLSMPSHLIGRPNSIMQNVAWSKDDVQKVVEGVIQKRSYKAIAEELQSSRPGAHENSVSSLISNRFGNIEGLLRENVQEPAELEELLHHYRVNKRMHSAKGAEGVREWKSRPSASSGYRPMRDDVLAERNTLCRVVAEGLVAKKSYASIAEEATREGVPTQVKNIERLLRSYHGVRGFLEHMEFSPKDAKAYADAY